MESSFCLRKLHVFFKDGKLCFLEVKGVTLEADGTALFPDAPTLRGVKHIEELIELKKQYPNAKTLAHPECKKHIIQQAEVVGSTQALLNYATNSEDDTFIVATESGILHEMKKQNPNKTFIPLPTDDNNKCNECNYMRMNTLEKLYQCLLNETNEIIVDENISKLAIKSINKMLEMSK